MGPGRRRGRGKAGRSATAGYARARRHVRRRRAEVAWWLAAAAGALAVAAAGAVRDGGAPWRDRSVSLAGAVAAAVAVAVAVLRRPPPDPERWRRGAAGEVATAELLDGLGRRRWVVLHDRWLPTGGANVDHLVIGRRGVWVIDSKAFRAPVSAGWRSVHVGDRRLDVAAATWEASVVADRLGVEVRPLVVLHGVVEHGGHLPRRGRRSDGVRVLRADTVVRHLRRARTGTRIGRRRMRDLAHRAAAVLPEA